MLQQVITAKEARQITKGRTPLVPVEYESAVKALTECCTLDEAKYWDNKADALAAWAKIYHSGEIMRKAKCLKLHAFRRMGSLAAELNPRVTRPGWGKGTMPGSGPRSLLIKNGLSVAEADAARMLSGLTQTKFNTLLKKPLAPCTYRWSRKDDGSAWHALARAIMQLRSHCRRSKPADVKIPDGEAANARVMAVEVYEWLEEFEQGLPKS